MTDSIVQSRIQLTDFCPLYVPLVSGDDYAVLIDSGTRQMLPVLLETMRSAGVVSARLRFVLHTHSHHDHIGSNAELKRRTGCLVAAHPRYRAWHSDFERHVQEFARPLPELVEDTAELREEVLGILDGEHRVDLMVDEGFEVDLGGVRLEALAFPGHMEAELGWLERSSRTLILGDAITGLDWPIFHSHLSVTGYRSSLDRIESLLDDVGITNVLFSHFPPASADETRALVGKARAYLDEIEVNLIRIVAESATVSVAALWTELCRRMERRREFRALNTVRAHVEDLLARAVIRNVGDHDYALR